MSSGAVILLSHDARGLGSFRRQCKIAAALHRQVPSAKLLLATSCDFPAPSNIQVLPLPQFAETKLRSELLLRYVQQHCPRAILVDKHPFGVRMDFRPALLWAYGNGIPCFYGLRDILDHPDRIRAEWLDVLPSIARYFRKVLVYGQRDLFDVSQYGLPLNQTEYCGYVSDGAGQHGSQGILCTVGAGDSNLANHVLKVFSDCAFPEHKTLICGPHSTFPLEGRSGQDNIRYCPHMDPLWSSHRAVVCLGGYNTLIEALAYGLHIICVPRMEPRLEQSVRAQLFAERGWIHCIHPEGLSVGALQKAAYQPLHPRDGPILSGAEIAARTIAHEAGLHS